MTLRQDTIDTWKISRNPGSNWRAIHASSALVVGLCLLVTSCWQQISDWPALFTSAGFLVLSVLSFAYWRHLLPEAKRISAIKSILNGEKQL